MNLITAHRILLNTDVIVDGNAPMGYCGNAGRVSRDVGRKEGRQVGIWRAEMSFTVYLDESGITDPQICVVAGFAATSLCWSMFAEEWRGALSEYGVGEFHAQVFFGRDPKGHMVIPRQRRSVFWRSECNW